MRKIMVILVLIVKESSIQQIKLKKIMKYRKGKKSKTIIKREENHLFEIKKQMITKLANYQKLK